VGGERERAFNAILHAQARLACKLLVLRGDESWEPAALVDAITWQ